MNDGADEVEDDMFAVGLLVCCLRGGRAVKIGCPLGVVVVRWLINEVLVVAESADMFDAVSSVGGK